MSAKFFNRYRFNTGVVKVTLYASEDKILGTELNNIDKLDLDYVFLTKSNKLIEQALTQLEEFFTKERTEFDLPLENDEDELVEKVTKEVKKVKFGETLTLNELAEKVGEDSKKVKEALEKIKFPVFVPKHRILDNKKKATSEANQALLDFEK